MSNKVLKMTPSIVATSPVKAKQTQPKGKSWASAVAGLIK